jgi:hypothetical protein
MHPHSNPSAEARRMTSACEIDIACPMPDAGLLCIECKVCMNSSPASGPLKARMGENNAEALQHLPASDASAMTRALITGAQHPMQYVQGKETAMSRASVPQGLRPKGTLAVVALWWPFGGPKAPNGALATRAHLSGSTSCEHPKTSRWTSTAAPGHAVPHTHTYHTHLSLCAIVASLRC